MTSVDGIFLVTVGAVAAAVLRAVFIEPHRQTQARLARLERDMQQLLRHFGLERSDTLSPAVREWLRQGKTIHAIRAYREETGAGLRDAKDAVEQAERVQ